MRTSWPRRVESRHAEVESREVAGRAAYNNINNIKSVGKIIARNIHEEEEEEKEEEEYKERLVVPPEGANLW